MNKTQEVIWNYLHLPRAGSLRAGEGPVGLIVAEEANILLI